MTNATNGGPPMDASLVVLVAVLTIEQRLLIGLTILGLWEYLITLSAEVEFVWQAGLTTAIRPGLFLCARWWILANIVVTLVGVSGIHFTCRGTFVYLVVTIGLDVLGFVIMSLFSALRICAIWNRSPTAFVVILALGIIPVPLNIAKVSRTEFVPVGDGTCEVRSEYSDHALYMYMVAITASRIITDILVLILTWLKTYSQVLVVRRFGFFVSISACLLRDGTFYFLCLFTYEVITLALYHTLAFGLSSIVLNTIPQVIVNRFIINLRRAGGGTAAMNSQTPSSTAVPLRKSQAFIADFAQPLDHGFDDELPVVDEEIGISYTQSERMGKTKSTGDDSRRHTQRSAASWGIHDVERFQHLGVML